MTGTIFVKPFGVELSDDAPGRDTVDAGLTARGQSYAQDDALNCLLEGQQPVEMPEPKKEEPEKRGSLIRDIASSVGEVATQPLGGVRDAAQSILELGD